MSIQKNILYIVLLFSTMMVFSCADNTQSEDTTNIEETTGNIQTTAPAGLTPANTAPASGEVAHFICPNNCEGSGGALQANCPVCGTAYTHNQAYHNQPGQEQKKPELVPMNAPGATNITGDIDVIQQSQPKAPAPAQNANGVWHFKCEAGCEGGGAAAGPCGVCGSALKHNKAYHN